MTWSPQVQARCSYKYTKYAPWETAWRFWLQNQVSTTRLNFCSGGCNGLHRPDLELPALSIPSEMPTLGGGGGELLALCVSPQCCPPSVPFQKPASVYTNLSEIEKYQM